MKRAEQIKGLLGLMAPVAMSAATVVVGGVAWSAATKRQPEIKKQRAQEAKQQQEAQEMVRRTEIKELTDKMVAVRKYADPEGHQFIDNRREKLELFRKYDYETSRLKKYLADDKQKEIPLHEMNCGQLGNMLRSFCGVILYNEELSGLSFQTLSSYFLPPKDPYTAKFEESQASAAYRFFMNKQCGGKSVNTEQDKRMHESEKTSSVVGP